MKIRTNYVSNSSSSSFIIIGNETNHPLKSLKEGKKVLAYIEACGTSGDVGDWIIPLTPQIYDIIINHNWFKHRAVPVYYETSNEIKMDYDEKIHEDILIVNKDVQDVKLLMCNKDYTSPENIEELYEFLKNRF